MDNSGMWVSVSLLLYVALSMSLKGRAASIVLSLYLGALAAMVALITWQSHRQWLALVSRAHREGWYTDATLAPHDPTLWHGCAAVAFILLLSVPFHIYDHWKRKMAGKPLSVA